VTFKIYIAEVGDSEGMPVGSYDWLEILAPNADRRNGYFDAKVTEMMQRNLQRTESISLFP
jgi:hypothetical protein